VSPEPFIRLCGVRKVYRTAGEEHLAISDATFDVMPGELVSLVGPSGCGKSTLLKVLAGLHPHDGGDLRIGSAANPFDPSRDVGMVFQAPLLLKWRRVLENVLLPAEILGLPLAAARERARELLALVGLSGHEDPAAARIEKRFQPAHDVHRRLAVLEPHILLLADADAVLAGAGAAQEKRLLHHAIIERAFEPLIVRLGVREDNQRVHVSVARVAKNEPLHAV